HSAGSEKLKADLRLDSFTSMRKGGKSDSPAVVPGKPEDSLLVTAVKYEEEGLQMPPKDKLPPEQIAAIEAWVKMGAPYPDETASVTTRPVALSVEQGREFWSFKRPVEQTPPKSADDPSAHNEIDCLID